jgi:hypothetical protein
VGQARCHARGSADAFEQAAVAAVGQDADRDPPFVQPVSAFEDLDAGARTAQLADLVPAGEGVPNHQ